MTSTILKGRMNPCYQCPDRYPACSGHCQKEEFLKWKAEKELIRKNREAYNNYHTPIWPKQEGHPWWKK